MNKEDFKDLVSNSNSFTDILKYFGFKSNNGGSYRTLRKRLEVDAVDYQHIKTGNNSNKGKFFPSKPLAEVMVEHSTYTRSSLKRRLIREGVIPYVCVECGQVPLWNNKKLSLVLDHKNGVNDDNRKENLRFLCPNCNSQTDTFAGKHKPYTKNNCKVCQKQTEGKSVYCIECSSKRKCCDVCGKAIFNKGKCRECNAFANRKVERPTKHQLEQEILQSNWRAIGRKYGVSDNGVRKWARSYRII
jgi:hypothetical protein